MENEKYHGKCGPDCGCDSNCKCAKEEGCACSNKEAAKEEKAEYEYQPPECSCD